MTWLPLLLGLLLDSAPFSYHRSWEAVYGLPCRPLPSGCGLSLATGGEGVFF